MAGPCLFAAYACFLTSVFSNDAIDAAIGLASCQRIIELLDLLGGDACSRKHQRHCPRAQYLGVADDTVFPTLAPNHRYTDERVIEQSVGGPIQQAPVVELSEGRGQEG